MKTKFIGLKGFEEIENLSSGKRKSSDKKSQNLSTTKKTVRFLKRASVHTIKSFKKLSGKTFTLAGEIFTQIKKTYDKSKKDCKSLIERFYRNHITNSNSKCSSTVKEATSNKKHAHFAPKTTNRTNSPLKKKAVLAVVSIMSAVTISCMTVAGAMDNNSKTEETITVNEVTANETASAMSSNAYTEMSKALIEDNIPTPCVGLYVDGELIGATNEIDTLSNALNQILIDYRADYDDNTTTKFANDVVVKNGDFNSADLLTAEQLIDKADDNLSISLSTDIVYTVETPYNTVVEYDDAQDTNYKKVKVEGVNKKENITMRTTYVDGVQTDAFVTGSEVITEAVDEVVVKGTQECGTGTGDFMWPVPYTHSISSYYGPRWGTMHYGIDIAAGGIYGQAIVASDNGTVVHSGDDGGGYGNYVIVDHGNGYSTVYAHCSSLAVSYGDIVKKGDTVGYVGSTGFSTGPHLHFEVREGSTKLNPLNFVS